MSSNTFTRLAEAVFGDEALASALAACTDPADFAAQAIRLAHRRGIDGIDAGTLDGGGNDPLGLARWTAPRLSGRAVPPRRWLPVQIAAIPAGPVVDWAWFGPEPLREPFFEDAVRHRLASPFARLFRYRTTLDVLVAQSEAQPARPPDGFIFHMSRCGSTLVAQMLAALPQSIVVSEAAAIDTVARLARTGSAHDDAAAARALRAIVMTYGRLRAGDERRYVVKLDSWHTLALPLIRRAFPDVPWVFLHRDPVEVLVSQMRQRGTQMLPQMLPPRFYGIDADGALPDEDYCARVLAAICNAALAHLALGGGCVVDYSDLPAAVFSTILPHFALTTSAAERTAMQQAATHDAKAPRQTFAADGAVKQREASAAVRRAAARHLAAIHDRLARAEAG